MMVTRRVAAATSPPCIGAESDRATENDRAAENDSVQP